VQKSVATYGRSNRNYELTESEVEKMSDSQEHNKTATSGQQFAIQKIYTRDLSLECPHAPGIFKAEWKPDVNVELSNSASGIADKTYEVVLTVTVTVKLGEQVAYLVEVKQAGIFLIDGFDPQPLDGLMGSYCPNILFPFAREVIADTIQRAGFPAFYLQPVNFDAIYAQHQQRRESETSQTKH
jgi:preprotein translocase subunit SecB